MNERKLKTGFSTGSAASAAVKAALTALLTGARPENVVITLPQGGKLDIEIRKCEVLSPGEARAMVIKDAGDDPDVTHRAEIWATVRLKPSTCGRKEIRITGGPGVGQVTRPGLPVAVGEAAINPVPRQMIEKSIRQVLAAAADRKNPPSVMAEISIPEGPRLAPKTLNPRLGIVGGLSILGTTGLVKPFSHEAYTSTIESGLNVALAMGLDEVVLTTGGKSEKKAMAMRPDLPEPAFIQIADFFGFALSEVKTRKLARLGLVSFFGKAVKQAQGLVYTHAHKAPMDLVRLSEWLTEAGASLDLVKDVAEANTARHALDLMREADALDLAAAVGKRLVVSCRRFAGEKVDLWLRILDYDGAVLFTWPDEDMTT